MLPYRTWLAVFGDGGEVARVLRGHRGVRTTLDAAVREGGPFLVEAHGVCYVFGGTPDEVALSKRFAEVCAFSVDTKSLRAARYRDGVLVREVAVRGGSQASVGRPGKKREPIVDALDEAGVLAFAEAWYCDPVAALASGRVHRVVQRRWAVAAARAQAGQVRQTRLWALFAVLLIAAVTFWVVQGRAQRGRDAANATLVCAMQADCGDCVKCANTPPHVCADAARTCVRNSACFALQNCFTACGDVRRAKFEQFAGKMTLDYTCDKECIARHPRGVDRYSAWASCVYCDGCGDTCGWQLALGGRGDLTLADCSEE